MLTVFQNFHTDPVRRAPLMQLYARYGLAMVDETSEYDVTEVDWIVNRARFIDVERASGFPNLRGIVVLGTDDWMVDLGSRPEIDVLTLDEDRGYEVAEHALALLLVALKCLPAAGALRRKLSLGGLKSLLMSAPAGETQGAHNWAGMRTGTIYGKKVGIVGYGLIGREIHKRLSGFGASIFYYRRSRYPAGVEQRLGMEYMALEAMFQGCDAIFVQLPLTPDTMGLISASLLSVAKSGMVLINCGRAAVVDEAALYQALKRRIIGYYAADVFWREPITLFDKFLRLDNCYITPHMAESLADRKHDMLENALQLIREHPERLHD